MTQTRAALASRNGPCRATRLVRAAMAVPASGTSGTRSLAYQELNRMLAASEVQVASLKARVRTRPSRPEPPICTTTLLPNAEAGDSGI